MNIFIRCFLFLSLSVYSYADANEKKWIPIQPINLNETAPSDSTKSKEPSSNKTVQNLEIIKNLLDHVNQTKPIEEKKKNWYSFEPAEE